MAYRHPSANLNGKNQADYRPANELDQFRLRLRILAMLRAFGPMTTERIIRRTAAEFSEELVRVTLKTLEEGGETWRPIQTQKWRLMR